MKINVTTDRWRDVVSSVLFETDEGEKLSVCMRDGGFEISVKDTNVKTTERGIEYYHTYRVMGGAVTELNAGHCNENYKGDPAQQAGRADAEKMRHYDRRNN